MKLVYERPKFIRRLVPLDWLDEWPAHVWLGASVGTQAAAAQRIPYLLEIPAQTRFLSCEPLVEPVTLSPWLVTSKLAWVICGGYSGAQDRPMDLAWAKALLAECRAYKVAFFLKQLGTVYAKQHGLRDGKGEDPVEFPEELRVQQFPVR